MIIPRQFPEAVFEEFLAYETKESYLIQPLCRAGARVVPIVLDRIKDKDLSKRQYAISFLGSGNYPESLPVLRKILEDDSELDVFRGDALLAIHLLDESMGTEYAAKYRNRSDYLGWESKRMLKVNDYKEYRRKEQDERCSPSD